MDALEKKRQESRIHKQSNPLLRAAILDQVDEVKRLLQNGYDMNTADDNGNTALHLAAAWNASSTVMVWLCTYGADIGSSNKYGVTPMNVAEMAGPSISEEGQIISAIHIFAALGDAESIKELIEEGIDCHRKDELGKTPLAIATKLKYEHVCAVLQPTLQSEAVESAHISPVYISDAPILLHQQVRLGNLSEVRRLITEERVDIATKDPQGNTALHVAVCYGHTRMMRYIDIIRFLESVGADKQAFNHIGKTPEALRNAFSYCATALHYEAVLGNETQIMHLIQKGLDVNGVDEEGNTPLHFAVQYKQYACALLLGERGADLFARNKKNETPWGQMLKHGYSDIEQNVEGDLSFDDPNRLFSNALNR